MIEAGDAIADGWISGGRRIAEWARGGILDLVGVTGTGIGTPCRRYICSSTIVTATTGGILGRDHNRSVVVSG